MIDIKVVGKSNFKITFYSMPDNRNGAVNDNFAIWSGTYQTVGKASNNSRLIQNTFLLANNTFKFDTPFNFPQAIQPPPLIERAHPIFLDLSDQSKYGIVNNIQPSHFVSSSDDVFEMRPTIIENEEMGKFYNKISINVKSYGYDNIDKFKEDYESMTLSFNFTISTNMNVQSAGNNFTNNKNWFTPISIKLSELGSIKPKKWSAFFAVFMNDNKYNNNSGNHNDEYNGWIFNVNNKYSGAVPPLPNQIASLTHSERLNDNYVNDLLWTNDSPSSGAKIYSSVWFKIMAFNEKNKAFLPLCTIFKFYHINAEKSLSTDFSSHF
ncbi:hypothetical protein [Spiroplasma endosymbiont of Virgichneumon dumeticola]|uniref:hypothetical protein n=1 Tax=Spiroplasma endosymbiont of Virgichneumon dumeticola TaxID=3139323 RepID=UPI0035C8DB65